MAANNPNTQLQIINKALVLVGSPTVGSITDGSVSANALNTVYEIALQEILSECNWNFAKTRIFLPTSSTTTTSSINFLYSDESIIYVLPTFGVVRIWNVTPPTALWRESNGYIISDSSGLGIEYTNYDDTPSDYPSYFIPAFIDKLCMDIAYVIINSPPVAKAFMEKYEYSLASAMSKNSQTGTQQLPADNDWVDAKYHDDTLPNPPYGAVAP